MAYYSDFDKRIIKNIAKCDDENMIVFGDLISKELFKIGKLGLVLTKEGNYRFYAKNEKEMKKLFGDIVGIFSLIKRLEESNLIYAFEMEIKEDFLFYEGRGNKMWLQGDRFYISNDRYIDCSGGEAGQLYKNGELELKSFMFDKNPETCKRLYKELKHVFRSLLYKTPELEEFVKNGYKTQDELHHEQVMEESKKQTKYAFTTLLVSIFALCVSILACAVAVINAFLCL